MTLRKIFLPLLLLGSFFTPLFAQQPVITSQDLDSKQQNIVTISSLAARGDLTHLQEALNYGLDAGLTINEVKEVLVHIYAYCGFPRSIRGLQTFMSVLDKRKANGINDKLGAEASPVKNGQSKYERGKDILGKLSGVPQAGMASGYSAFAPVIDTFLKEHLFADIFERDVLSYADRELVTISVLASIGGVEPMLKSHLGICLNVGFTANQLRQFEALIKKTISKKHAKSLRSVLNEVLVNRKKLNR
ncbi:MAG: carboxymuconolactone decarboxylase family protein [Bacteroidota bacterium]